jgi:ankyrin repeat protein
LLLTGATLIHVAAEFGAMEAARLLLSRGADVNAHGGSGQSPIFHSVTQYGDAGLAMAQLLLENGADLTVRTTLPGHYDRPDDFPECTPLAMQCFSRAMNFPGRMRRRLNC